MWRGPPRRIAFADGLVDLLQERSDIKMLPFGLDDDAGIEDYSQDGGFHGWLRLAMRSSTSFMKPSSSVTVEPRASARAMHSDSSRPWGTGGRMIATGRWSCSTTISAPARDRRSHCAQRSRAACAAHGAVRQASTAWVSRASSASVMRIVAIASIIAFVPPRCPPVGPSGSGG